MKKKTKNQLISLITVFFIFILLLVLIFRSEALISFFQSILDTHPYLISFASGFFSTISILIPLFSYPFYLIMFSLLQGGFGNIFLIVLMMGLGTTLGDLFSYSITYFPSLRFLHEGKNYEKKFDSILKPLQNKILKPLRERGVHLEETWKFDFTLSFIFGIFPLPDDLLMLYFGLKRRDLRPILIGNWIGRSLMYLFIYLGLFSISAFLEWSHIFF